MVIFIQKYILIIVARMGAHKGGGQEGALAPPPPLEIKKYGGPHKDNLTRKN